MFYQKIENGNPVEHPNHWLRYGNHWEFPRPELLFPMKFGGHVVQFKDEQGQSHFHWIDTEEVMAMDYDTPVPGYGTNTVNNVRLWSAKASRDFKLKYFNQGTYIRAVKDKNASENLSKMLYPDDPTQFCPVFDALIRYGDHFLLLADYVLYIVCQEQVDALYHDPEGWIKRALF